MSIPTYEELMLPVLRGASTGVRRIPELSDEVASGLGLSQTDREALLPSGKQRVLHNRMHWAKFYMTKAGLIDTPQRGSFTASPAGRALLETNPTKIDKSLLLTYPTFAAFIEGEKQSSETTPTETSDDVLTPEERIDAAADALDHILREELIQRISKASPTFFEGVIVDLLVAMGYGGSHSDAAQRIGRSGDGGVDGVINEDRLGLDRIYIQAKRYATGNVVGRPELQAFVGSLMGFGANKGVFVTTSTFTQNARDYSRHLTQRIRLIDGAELSALLIEHDVGVRVAREVRLKRMDEDYFVEDE